jgi:hypothetical protein
MKANEMGGASGTYVGEEREINDFGGYLKAREHLQDLGGDGV